jgi:hypothetical protein
MVVFNQPAAMPPENRKNSVGLPANEYPSPTEKSGEGINWLLVLLLGLPIAVIVLSVYHQYFK